MDAWLTYIGAARQRVNRAELQLSGVTALEEVSEEPGGRLSDKLKANVTLHEVMIDEPGRVNQAEPEGIDAVRPNILIMGPGLVGGRGWASLPRRRKDGALRMPTRPACGFHLHTGSSPSPPPEQLPHHVFL
ncbi:unnamed protein product [Gadus morhua 'NCC']